MSIGEGNPLQNRRFAQTATGAGTPTGKDSPSRVDEAWADLNRDGRYLTDLVAVLHDDRILIEYKQRAFDVLLSPNKRTLPYPTNIYSGFPSLGLKEVKIGDISDDLARYIAGRLPDFIEQARELLLRDSTNDFGKDGIKTYNDLIPLLLAKLSPEEAEELFARFSISDPVLRLGVVDDSFERYQPLRSLYGLRTLDETWKRKAADQMHETIRREQTGEAKPLAKLSRGFSDYARILESLLDDRDGLPVTNAFFEEEVAFLLGIDTEYPPFHYRKISDVLDFLSDDALRHTFVRIQLLPHTKNPDYHFRIHDFGDVSFARRIIDQFPDDTELVDYLNSLIHLWETARESVAILQERERNDRQAILDRMRQPIT